MDFNAGLAEISDEQIQSVVQAGDIPALLAALATALGDLRYIPAELTPAPAGFQDATYGLSPEEITSAKNLAIEGLAKLRDHVQAGHTPTSDVETEKLREILSWAAGGASIDEYLELLQEELGLGDDLRAPNWNLATTAPDRNFRVLIVGAGMSGILAAHRARQAGLEVVVIEKNAEVGGTWFENNYPGCRVDVSNLFYSYSFAQRTDWPEHFSSQEVLRDYFQSIAQKEGLNELIRFNTEVTEMRYADDTATWSVSLRLPDGSVETIEANAIVSAVGQLNQPKMPDIKGLDRFTGPSFHSARWNPDVDLEQKRVVVIGTGASAAQLIPHLAETASHLTVFQRTPGWFLPSPQYTDRVNDEVMWLRQNLPTYTNWSRFWTFWRNVEGMMPFATVDPNWDGGERSVSAANDMMRELLTAYLRNEFAERPDLADKVIPEYPPFAKRFIMDNGIWAKTLMRENVELVTDGIEEITAEGVLDTTGMLHKADVIVFGTGFAASDFLTPMKVVGANGADLHQTWNGDARAYLGLTLPQFPNFFMLYGPNTNIVANGSIIYFSECGVNYIIDAIHQLLEQDAKAIDLKPEVHDRFNEAVDQENLKLAWGVSSVNSWYKNATGRTAQNWPFTLLDYWQRTHRADLSEYEIV